MGKPMRIQFPLIIDVESDGTVPLHEIIRAVRPSVSGEVVSTAGWRVRWRLGPNSNCDTKEE